MSDSTTRLPPSMLIVYEYPTEQTRTLIEQCLPADIRLQVEGEFGDGIAAFLPRSAAGVEAWPGAEAELRSRELLDAEQHLVQWCSRKWRNRKGRLSYCQTKASAGKAFCASCYLVERRAAKAEERLRAIEEREAQGDDWVGVGTGGPKHPLDAHECGWDPLDPIAHPDVFDGDAYDRIEALKKKRPVRSKHTVEEHAEIDRQISEIEKDARDRYRVRVEALRKEHPY